MACACRSSLANHAPGNSPWTTGAAASDGGFATGWAGTSVERIAPRTGAESNRCEVYAEFAGELPRGREALTRPALVVTTGAETLTAGLVAPLGSPSPLARPPAPMLRLGSR